MTRKLLELIWDSLRSQYSGNITNWMFLHSGAHVFLPGGSLSTVLHDVSSSDSDWCLAFTFLCDLKCSVIIRWASFNVLRALLAYLKDSYNTCCIRENWVYYVICRTWCICNWIVLSSTVLWNVLMFVLLFVLFKYVYDTIFNCPCVSIGYACMWPCDLLGAVWQWCGYGATFSSSGVFARASAFLLPAVCGYLRPSYERSI